MHAQMHVLKYLQQKPTNVFQSICNVQCCWICIFRQLVICELHSICMSNFWDSPPTQADSQIHFSQQGIVWGNQTSPFFSASHTNASLPPEAVLPPKSQNLAKGTSNKSRTFWSLGGCWHWRQDILCQSSSPVYDLNEQQGLPRALPSLKAWNSGVASLCCSAVVSEPQQICNTPRLQNESHVHKPAP